MTAHGRWWARLTGVWALLALLVLTVGGVSGAESFADDAFERTWARTDRAVAEHVEARTWMWGPHPVSGGLYEHYVSESGNKRLVQYFDKSRMEINDPDGDESSAWFVTNGLLATEMITGRMQYGDSHFIDYGPAEIPVAGDMDDQYGPTYATFWSKTYVPLEPAGVITRRINRAGLVWDDPSLAVHGVDTPVYVEATNHRIASVFWEFMNQSGTVYQDGKYLSAPLFENPYYATGLPITEAYWAEVKVGGVYRDVLTQCFERRCLTYTPGNPEGFEVEAGNVGLHYYAWRYEAEREEQVATVFLIDPGSDGSTGMPVGCGDSLVGVQRVVGVSDDVATNVQRALEELFALDGPFYGESGLYNALYQSNVAVTDVSVTDGEAVVAIEGSVVLSGVCDEPRVVGQIVLTVLNVPGVTSASITLNGEPIH